MKKALSTIIALLLYTLCFCQSLAQRPSWIRRANIYEVNVRQYTKAGTFKAFERHLDRLKQMGVEILWFMPVNPISKIDRKGSLGSYYAVADYTAVNPEFGTLADFRQLVQAIHARGMKAILDWVPNHTGADNRWLREHPGFYKRDSSGKAAVPFDWTDTRQLDYDNPELRDSMIASMQYWIRTTNIDGFRCDVAWNVPGDFWRTCIARLRKMKPLFMLAEGDKPYLAENGFDAIYPWDMFHMMVMVAKGERPAFALDSVLRHDGEIYPKGTLRMYFTSNHDENSWNGADFQTFPGPAHGPFAVLTQTLPADIPLIYGGQEEPVLRSLSFFEKDSIRFSAFGRSGFYQTLLALRKRNAALDEDASFERLEAGDNRSVYSFLRKKSGQKLLVLLNLSPAPQDIRFKSGLLWGHPNDIFTGKTVAVNGDKWTLEPWGYRVFEYPAEDTVKDFNSFNP
jgi:alpha-amylase